MVFLWVIQKLQEDVQNLSGPSGLFPCSTCFMCATYEAIDGFHWFKNTKDKPLRSRTNTIINAMYLATWGVGMSSLGGVTGLSILVLLNLFDYIRDCVIDPMHNIFLHVVPNFLDLWLDEKYKVIDNHRPAETT